ncbi:hypothetical protein FA743_19860 [Paracoccus gahaiensis]|uniref:DUF2259 domain-containing protein n=1 Tax=Paracoccus gahaiensis TaxID=1706839 RepID=A0A4U0RL51_9RHOB|nr:hypothetical protein [Paracoccus gahaiensis]TJZ88744.1 hypothetical protein FA743_19860 [Paracoccus gahaiensis]
MSPLLPGLLLILASYSASAQKASLARVAEPVDGHINEHFDSSGSADVGGGLIIGALLGQVAEAFPPDQIWIATPSERIVLCLQAVSRDGRYSTRTRYSLTSDADGMEGARLSPFTHLSEKLKQYADDDVAVIATAADDRNQCRSGEMRLFPRVQPDLTVGEADLLLQVNIAGRSAAWIVTEDGSRTDCMRVTADQAIGFEMTCRVKARIGTTPSTLHLALWVDDGLQAEPTSHLMVIPGYGSPK